jgi:hypothetical protein
MAKNDYVWNCIGQLMELIRQAENFGARPGKEKLKEVIKKFLDFIESLPRDQVPAIFKGEKRIKNLEVAIATFILFFNFLVKGAEVIQKIYFLADKDKSLKAGLTNKK